LNESEVTCLAANSSDEGCHFVPNYYNLAEEKYQDILIKEFCAYNYSVRLMNDVHNFVLIYINQATFTPKYFYIEYAVLL